MQLGVAEVEAGTLPAPGAARRCTPAGVRGDHSMTRGGLCGIGGLVI